MKTETNTQNEKVENRRAKGSFARSLGRGIRVLFALALTVAAGVGGAFLFFGEEGAQIAKNLVQARVTLAQSSSPVFSLSHQIIPFSVPKGGHVEVAARISASGEANVYVLSASQLADFKARRDWTVQHGFRAPDATGSKFLAGHLAAGDYALLIQNENIFHDIRVDCTVIEDFKR